MISVIVLHVVNVDQVENFSVEVNLWLKTYGVFPLEGTYKIEENYLWRPGRDLNPGPADHKSAAPRG